MKIYSHKVVKSGAVTEIYSYSSSRVKNVKKIDEFIDEEIEENKKIEKKERIEKEDKKRRKSDINRLKKKMNRLLHANFGQYKHKEKFLTLTFEGKNPTREEVLYRFKKFMLRFKYYYGDTFEYISVIERGMNGTKRLHLHLICFNLPYIDIQELKKIWKYGRIDLRVVKNLEVVSYMTKYIDKNFDEENNHEKGKKLYFPSRGLKKSTEIYLNDEELNEFLELLPGNPYFQFSYHSDFVGDVDYIKFVDMEKLDECTSY
ncbi:MAG: hypothetical protein ACK5LZ_06090 [Anaerorhabdus sp.]